MDCGAWNYHPDVPIQQGGIFRRFWDPLFIIKGIILSWFGLYIRGVFLAIITIFMSPPFVYVDISLFYVFLGVYVRDICV